MQNRFWRFETGVFLGIWLVLMATAWGSGIRDPGVPWHIVVGEQILTRGELVRMDPFSCTRAGVAT